MSQDRDERGRFAPGGGPQPRGGRDWKTAGAKKTKKTKGAKAKKKVRAVARRADQAAGQKGMRAARKIVRTLAKKADEEIKKDPFL